MIVVKLLGLIALASVSSGASLDRDTRIVNGVPIPEGAAPWQVSLNVKNYGSPHHYCGGSLIAHNWVLTAAHCLEPFVGKVDQIGVKTGISDVRSEAPLYDVTKLIIHPGWNSQTVENDIGLLKIVRNTRNAKGEAISLERDGDPPISVCNVTGFGKDGVNGVLTNRLIGAPVALWTTEDCSEQFGSGYIIDSDHVCAGGERTDACQGDSGGPMACCTDDSLSAESCRLSGIVSWGLGCATEGYPGVYTRVSHYVDWINSEMEN